MCGCRHGWKEHSHTHTNYKISAVNTDAIGLLGLLGLLGILQVYGSILECMNSNPVEYIDSKHAAFLY